MKKRISIVLVFVAILTACASTLNVRWPVNVVPWERVTDRLDSAEVVILCLVDSYDVGASDSGRAKEGLEPSWSNTPRPTVRQYTPGQMLQSYLSSVRSLDGRHVQTSAGDVDPKKMTILIVENGTHTRNRAKELFAQFGRADYDRSIPVIFVFHKKQLIKTYTYYSNPGRNGSDLGTLVDRLLTSN